MADDSLFDLQFFINCSHFVFIDKFPVDTHLTEENFYENRILYAKISYA